MLSGRLALIVCVAAFVIAMPFRSDGQALPGSRILVLPFTAEADPAAPGGAGGNLWLGEAAAVLLTDELSALGVPTIARDERLAAFDRLGLPMRAALTRATMIRVGELLGASEIVFGQMRLAERLDVRVRMVQLHPGRQLPDLQDAASLPEIFDVFQRLSRRVAESAGAVPVQAPAFPRLPLEAFEAYVKGLVAATPAAGQRFLETAMSLAPADPRILLALWRVYTDQGDHEKALSVAHAIGADRSLGRKARYAVALSLIELRRFDGAHKELLQLIADRPAPALYNAVGVVQLRRGVLTGQDAASSYFRRAVEAQPDATGLLFNLGYALALAKNATAALQWLRETVRFDAANGDAHLVMSSLLAGAGRTVEAQRELELARLLGTSIESAQAAPAPAIPPGLERLDADLEIDSPVQIEAVVANPAQRDQHEVAMFHLERGRKLFADGRDRDALGELRRAAYLAPYEEEPHRLLGQLYRRAGRLKDAIDELTVANWAKETVAGRVALGTVLLESGDKDGARREAERALVLDPKSDEARALLKKIGVVPSMANASSRSQRTSVSE
jgi:tetratricopeptide (TPR) repeat protein